jgi:hypothetical protein
VNRTEASEYAEENRNPSTAKRYLDLRAGLCSHTCMHHSFMLLKTRLNLFMFLASSFPIRILRHDHRTVVPASACKRHCSCRLNVYVEYRRLWTSSSTFAAVVFAPVHSFACAPVAPQRQRCISGTKTAYGRAGSVMQQRMANRMKSNRSCRHEACGVAP